MTQEPDLQRMEEDRMTRALEQAPAVAVPSDFAARLMVRLPFVVEFFIGREMRDQVELPDFGF